MQKNKTRSTSQDYKSGARALSKAVERRTWVTYVSAVFLSLFFVIVSVAVSMSVVFPLISAHADATASVNIWWPAENFPVSGTQPFKAMVEGMDVSQYEMFWQVDGGVWNWMGNNYTDYPHKETIVNLSGWNWRGSGPYTINFIARKDGNIIAQKSLQLRLNTSQPAPQVSAPQVVSQPVVSQAAAPAPTVIQTILAPVAVALVPVAKAATVTSTNTTFYTDPNSPSAKQASDWRASRPSDAAMMDVLAAQPTAKWLGGWNANVQSDVQTVQQAANAKGQTAVYAVYNIPGRDCGGFSAGGATVDTYASWVKSIAQGIGSGKAVVILEPDSLASISCLSATEQQTRLNLLSGAVDVLKANPNTKVYLDAGHSGWIDTTTMAGLIKKANIAKADGFFLDVSNFNTTASETTYGTAISGQLGGKHFVIDTSRNGLGPNGSEWCNPLGRAIGQKPTTSTGNSLIDAYLWVKTPGESDGNCNGGPNAGQWWPEYALGLVQRAQ